MANCTYFDKETTVQGKLSTGDLVVEGSFDGEIFSKGKVLFKKTARIDATLNAQKLMVEEGAIFNGRISLRNGET